MMAAFWLSENNEYIKNGFLTHQSIERIIK